MWATADNFRAVFWLAVIPGFLAFALIAFAVHAGDGNLHPLILYDANQPGEIERAEAFGADILKLCVEVGGVLTGEHGVGVEKRDLMPEMFSDIDLAQQQRLKCAFDTQGLLNPGKVFPTLHRCAELGRVHGKQPERLRRRQLHSFVAFRQPCPVANWRHGEQIRGRPQAEP